LWALKAEGRSSNHAKGVMLLKGTLFPLLKALRAAPPWNREFQKQGLSDESRAIFYSVLSPRYSLLLISAHIPQGERSSNNVKSVMIVMTQSSLCALQAIDFFKKI
jgi:hypothetical protein